MSERCGPQQSKVELGQVDPEGGEDMLSQEIKEHLYSVWYIAGTQVLVLPDILDLEVIHNLQLKGNETKVQWSKTTTHLLMAEGSARCLKWPGLGHSHSACHLFLPPQGQQNEEEQCRAAERQNLCH